MVEKANVEQDERNPNDRLADDIVVLDISFDYLLGTNPNLPDRVVSNEVVVVVGNPHQDIPVAINTFYVTETA